MRTDYEMLGNMKRCKGRSKFPDSANANDRFWAIVVWNGVEEPELFEAECFLTEVQSWPPVA